MIARGLSHRAVGVAGGEETILTFEAPTLAEAAPWEGKRTSLILMSGAGVFMLRLCQELLGRSKQG